LGSNFEQALPFFFNLAGLIFLLFTFTFNEGMVLLLLELFLVCMLLSGQVSLEDLDLRLVFRLAVKEVLGVLNFESAPLLVHNNASQLLPPFARVSKHVHEIGVKDL
jgi:hypothetical protein